LVCGVAAVGGLEKQAFARRRQRRLDWSKMTPHKWTTWSFAAHVKRTTANVEKRNARGMHACTATGGQTNHSLPKKNLVRLHVQ
jgi:hypothetical protein